MHSFHATAKIDLTGCDLLRGAPIMSPPRNAWPFPAPANRSETGTGPNCSSDLPVMSLSSSFLPRTWKTSALCCGFHSPASKFLPFRQGGYRTSHLLRKEWHRPRRILDPGGDAVLKWNRVFLVSCLVALFLDPLYFYLMFIGGPACMKIDQGIGIIVTFFRTVADLFYLAHMLLKFRTAFVAPSSRVFGRGELVKDPHQIAMRYLKGDFVIDLAAMLPIPQAWLRLLN